MSTRERLEEALSSPRARQLGLFAAWAVAGFLATLLAAILISMAVGEKLVTIDSGSQAPALRDGDVAFERQVAASDVKVDQIITFSDPETGDRVTHRVKATADYPGRVRLLTKGDSSDTFERFSLPEDGEVGVVVRRIPFAGHIADALGGPLALLLLIGAVAGLAGGLRVSRRRLRPEM